jgi:3-oxoadipate enol-lactonase
MNRRTGLAIGAGMLAIAGAASQVRRKPRPVPLPGTMRVIDGETIHYIDRGSGPAIVFIHGFGGNTGSWRFALEHFGTNHRVVALDLPGFGWSSRDATLALGHEDHASRVVRLMDELGIEQATLVGHSMGGGIALRTAVRNPERVNGLVLVGSVDPNGEATWQRAERRMWGLNLMGPMMERNPRLISRVVGSGLRQMSFDPSWVDASVVKLYVQPLLQPGTAKCLVRLAHCASADPRIDLSGIHVPTLLVCGAADTAMPMAISESIRAGMAGARLEVLEKAGHLVAEEQPEVFHAMVDQFLAESVEPAGP